MTFLAVAAVLGTVALGACLARARQRGVIAFASNRSGATNLYQKAAGSSGKEQERLHSPEFKRPNSWSPDERFLLWNRCTRGCATSWS